MKITMAGIKDFEAQKSRCKKEDRNIRMTTQKGNGVRQRTKLLGKSAWSKKKNTGAKEQGTNVKGVGRGGKYRTPGIKPKYSNVHRTNLRWGAGTET